MRLQLVWTGILFVLPVMAVFTFVKEDWIHDRHMYLVSVPVCLIVAALLTDPKLPRKASVVISSLILLLLLFEAAVQVPRFSDGISIYESALKVAPSNALAHRYYALALNGYGRNDEAFREYRITADLWPGDPTICGSYADALAEVGRNEEAAAEYAEALRRTPKPTRYRAYLLYRLGTIEVKKSKLQEGEVHLREALQIAPQTLSYHGMLATALRQQGRLQEADAETHLEDGVRKTFLRENPR